MAAAVTFAVTGLMFACGALAAGANGSAGRASSAAAPVASVAFASDTGLGGFQPLTPWRQPSVELPPPRLLAYKQLAEAGVSQASHWRHGAWYCEYLRCTHGPYPLVTLWGELPLFEPAHPLDMASPSSAPQALVDRFARANELYWDGALGGYAPYPGD